MTTEKVLDRLQKMKAMAEGAKAIGSEQEAQAFADMLQKLLLDHKLQMSDLEFQKMEAEQPVEQHTIDQFKHGMKFKNKRVEWQETLAQIVADAHFCRIMVTERTNLITLIGRAEDIAVSEYLFVTLCRALDKIADLELWKYRYEQIKTYGKRGGPAAKGFRASFVNAFLGRLRQRFAEQRAARVNGQSTALTRIDKSTKAVNDYINNLNCSTAKDISRSVKFHAEGVKRGRDAADKINLRPLAVATQGQSVYKLLDAGARMATITSRGIVNEIIAAKGKQYADEPAVIRIVEYTNPSGESCFGVVWDGEQNIHRYEQTSEFICNPRVIFSLECICRATVNPACVIHGVSQ